MSKIAVAGIGDPGTTELDADAVLGAVLTGEEVSLLVAHFGTRYGGVGRGCGVGRGLGVALGVAVGVGVTVTVGVGVTVGVIVGVGLGVGVGVGGTPPGNG